MPDQDLEEHFARAHPSLSTFRRIFPFVRPYWRQLVICMVIEVAFVGLWALDPHFIKIAVDEFILQGVFKGAVYVAGLMALNSVLRAAMSAVQQLSLWRTGENTLNDVRKHLFAHIQHLSMNFFDREKQGHIIARVDRDVEFLGQLIIEAPILIVHTLSSMVVVGFILITYDWRLCVLVAALAPAVGAAAWASSKWGLPAYRSVRRSMSRMTANLVENVSGVHVVQAFGREEQNLSTYQTLLSEYKANTMVGAMVRGITFPGMMFVFGLANAAVIAYAAYGVPRGYVTIGEIPATIMYIGMIYGPIMMIAQMYDQFLAASAAAERVVQLMDSKPSITDKPGARDIPTIKGHIAFEHVHFKYDSDPHSPWILEDVSFDAKPGDIVALVGPTGSGKSSIVNLIPRFYEPQRGRITVDGHDIYQVKQKSLQDQIGVVLQENFLFTGTVMDNLKFGRPETTDEEAVAAAKALGSHHTIERLAQGYQTDARERGAAISHGERQLICFTRALIADPRILILDEATSSVDTDTEIAIQRALWKLMEGRTAFVVAHRLSTVRHASKIFVIQDGKIVESGTHHQLLALNRSYAGMFEEFMGHG